MFSSGYNNQHGRNYVSVIPTNVFGPNDNFHLQDSHVISGLIHKIYLTKTQPEKYAFKVNGTGKPLRQFIYSRDLGRLMIWTVRSYDEKDPIFLSVGEKEELPIVDAVKHICVALDYPFSNLEFDTSKADGQFKKTASNERLMKLLPNFQFTPFDVAVKETCDWFVRNYDSARKWWHGILNFMDNQLMSFLALVAAKLWSFECFNVHSIDFTSIVLFAPWQWFIIPVNKCMILIVLYENDDLVISFIGISKCFY